MRQTQKGIHHITAVAGNPRENYDFYAGVLGFRLVKKTVNYDDPSVYHLYYGDEFGRPGSILTFFPWSHLQNGKPNRGQVVAVAFAVPPASLDFWRTHLQERGVEVTEPFVRFEKKVIGFRDPDGLHLEIVADSAVSDMDGWAGGPVSAGHSIRGLHGATLAERDGVPTARLLRDHLGFSDAGDEMGRMLLTTKATIGSRIEIIDGSDLDGRPGKGTVHHIAFRVRDNEEQRRLRKALLDAGYHTTDQKDRNYFRSVYFHEPGGVLFELATDPPGFTRDEEAERLGEELKLPQRLEKRRNLIEAELPELVTGGG